MHIDLKIKEPYYLERTAPRDGSRDRLVAGGGPLAQRRHSLQVMLVIPILILAILILTILMLCRRLGAGAGRGCPAPGAPGGSPACGGSRPGAPASKVPTQL